MEKWKKSLFLLPVIVFVCLCFTGCGDKKEEASENAAWVRDGNTKQEQQEDLETPVPNGDFTVGEEDWDGLRQWLLELAPELAGGGAVGQESPGLPYTVESCIAYDITGDGKEELFVYVEPIENWDNEGFFYILSLESDGNYAMLSENRNFRKGFTEILAPDGTELLPLLYYSGASSWKGGIRWHLGYREGTIVVDMVERYVFHGDAPLINYVNDYREGRFLVYVARQDTGGEEGYSGQKITMAESLKIDEEIFWPILLSFADFGDYDEEGYSSYPALYYSIHPFDEGWWEDGGLYPEHEGESGLGIADWIEEAAGDRPDEMLEEAVTRSGYEMERKVFPWTEETKANVEELLRCPVADYYYISEEYIAVYERGNIYFYERTTGDGMP